MVMMAMAVMAVMEGPLQDPRRKYSARSGTGLSTGNMEMDGAGLSKWKTALRPGGSTGGKPRRCPHPHPNPRDERRTFPEQREPHHGRSRPGGAAASARGAQRPAAAAEQAESEAHRARRPQSGPRSPPGPGIPVPPSERLPRSQRAREPGRRVVGGRPRAPAAWRALEGSRPGGRGDGVRTCCGRVRSAGAEGADAAAGAARPAAKESRRDRHDGREVPCVPSLRGSPAPRRVTGGRSREARRRGRTNTTREPAPLCLLRPSPPSPSPRPGFTALQPRDARALRKAPLPSRDNRSVGTARSRTPRAVAA